MLSGDQYALTQNIHQGVVTAVVSAVCQAPVLAYSSLYP